MDALTELVPVEAWYRYSAGDGSKGRRWYSWALIEILAEPEGPDLGFGHHLVLVRRNDTTGPSATTPQVLTEMSEMTTTPTDR